jgi:hypothetical protein
MPIISRFFGIVIYMYWKDHAPPHFHAKYGDDEIVVEVGTGNVSGYMSNRAIKLIQEWRQLHKDELLKDWKLAEQKKALFAIDPLE